MTRITVVLVLLMGAIAVPIRAQEAAQPTVDLAPKTNEKRPAAATPTLTPAPASQLPDLPELSQLDEAFKQTSLGTKADQSRMHIEWRRLRNRVANDPQIVAARKVADGARTDLEKRERLRRYYDLYYTRMQELTDRAEIKAGLEDMKKQHLGLADQNRVRPSPSPSASSSPASSPTPQAMPEENDRPSPSSPVLPAEPVTPTPSSPAELNQP